MTDLIDMWKFSCLPRSKTLTSPQLYLLPGVPGVRMSNLASKKLHHWLNQNIFFMSRSKSSKRLEAQLWWRSTWLSWSEKGSDCNLSEQEGAGLSTRRNKAQCHCLGFSMVIQDAINHIISAASCHWIVTFKFHILPTGDETNQFENVQCKPDIVITKSFSIESKSVQIYDSLS